MTARQVWFTRMVGGTATGLAAGLVLAAGAPAAGQAPSANRANDAAAAPNLPQTPYVAPQLELFDARATTVRFACDAPPGNICYFHVQSALRNFAQRFAVSASGRVIVTGVIPGVDRYVVTVNQVPPLQIDCRAAADQRKFCKVAVVQAGTNN